MQFWNFRTCMSPTFIQAIPFLLSHLHLENMSAACEALNSEGIPYNEFSCVFPQLRSYYMEWVYLGRESEKHRRCRCLGSVYHWLASYLAIVIFGADECRDNARINQSFLELPVTFTMRWGGQQTKCMYAAGTAHVPELFIKSKERSLLVDGALIMLQSFWSSRGFALKSWKGELASIAGATQYVHSIRNTQSDPLWGHFIFLFALSLSRCLFWRLRFHVVVCRSVWHNSYPPPFFLSQLRTILWSCSCAPLDDRQPHVPNWNLRPLRSSNLWWPTLDEEFRVLEMEERNVSLEPFFECLFDNWHVANSPSALA